MITNYTFWYPKTLGALTRDLHYSAGLWFGTSARDPVGSFP